MLSGATRPAKNVLLSVLWSILLLGGCLAVYFKRHRVEVHNRIGSQ
ncbi:hypothetical protein AB0D91_40200 [Streptomyces canus]